MEKIKVNKNCIGCGACTAIAPEYFEFNEEGLAQATDKKIEDNDKQDILEAKEGCPTSAIETE